MTRSNIPYNERTEALQDYREKFRCAEIGVTSFRAFLHSIGMNATDAENEINEHKEAFNEAWALKYSKCSGCNN